MIKYWGEDEYDLFGFDLEVGDERSWGCVCFIPKNMHGAGYVLNLTVSPMAWVVLRTGSFDWIKRWAKWGGESTEYWENQDIGNWVSSISGVAIDDEWWMIDDGLSVVGLAVMRLWGDGKSKGCLMLAELDLDICQDQHPCSTLLENTQSPTPGSLMKMNLPTQLADWQIEWSANWSNITCFECGNPGQRRV